MPQLQPYPGTPRWVKRLGLAALLVAALFALGHLSGVGGPARHFGHTSAEDAPFADGHTPGSHESEGG